MISRDHVVRESCNIMGEFLSLQVTTLSHFVAIDVAEEETFFFNWSCDLT